MNDRRPLDGVSEFLGLRWESPQIVRLTIRPELINAGGLLSGVVTYALVDYCMGSTLFAQTTRGETQRNVTRRWRNESSSRLPRRFHGSRVCAPRPGSTAIASRSLPSKPRCHAYQWWPVA